VTDSCAAAWLLANLILIFNRMNNAAFCRAFHIRNNMFPVMGSRKWCLCVYLQRSREENEIRNPDHARLTAVLRRLCQSHSSQILLSVGLEEPHCKDYFQPSIVIGESESKQSHVVKEDTTYLERRAHTGMLDITMERPSILIDCTMVAPNAACIKDYANSGQAAELAT
jgi:hypothetical protein